MTQWLMWILLIWCIYRFLFCNTNPSETFSPSQSYLINAVQRRNLIQSKYGHLTPTTVFAFVPFAFDDAEYYKLVNFVNASSINCYFTKEKSERQILGTNLVNSMVPWAEKHFDVVHFQNTKAIYLISDLVVAIHLFLGDPEVSLKTADVDFVVQWISNLMAGMMNTFKPSNNFVEVVPYAWIICNQMLCYVLQDRMESAKTVGSMLQTISKTLNANDIKKHLDSDVAGETVIRFCTHFSYFMFTLWVVNVYKDRLLYNYTYPKEVIKDVCTLLKQSLLQKASYINRMTDLELTGLVFSWVVFAANMDGSLLDDSGIRDIHDSLKEKVWSGIGGSTWLHFADPRYM